jgi:mRNA interferase HigB
VKVLGRDKLTKFSKKHADAKGALDAWYAEVSKDSTQWKTAHDIKACYSSADFLSDNRVIFNIKGNHHRLVARVRYQNGIVVIEWIGTHAEYDRKNF